MECQSLWLILPKIFAPSSLTMIVNNLVVERLSMSHEVQRHAWGRVRDCLLCCGDHPEIVEETWKSRFNQVEVTFTNCDIVGN